MSLLRMSLLIIAMTVIFIVAILAIVGTIIYYQMASNKKRAGETSEAGKASEGNETSETSGANETSELPVDMNIDGKVLYNPMGFNCHVPDGSRTSPMPCSPDSEQWFIYGNKLRAKNGKCYRVPFDSSSLLPVPCASAPEISLHSNALKVDGSCVIYTSGAFKTKECDDGSVYQLYMQDYDAINPKHLVMIRNPNNSKCIRANGYNIVGDCDAGAQFYAIPVGTRLVRYQNPTTGKCLGPSSSAHCSDASTLFKKDTLLPTHGQKMTQNNPNIPVIQLTSGQAITWDIVDA
jgi:hypothetical protein